jgi:hypothetical protein
VSGSEADIPTASANVRFRGEKRTLANCPRAYSKVYAGNVARPRDWLLLVHLVSIRPRYNIAPTTKIDVVVPHEAGRDLLSMR